MKGIILAGGHGTRLHPITTSVNKQLLPVYNKPMVYYPLSILMLSKITEILIITAPTELHNFKNLLGDGTQWGLQISFATQQHPNGLAEAFIIGEQFIGKDNVCLILGDNIFYGSSLGEKLEKASTLEMGALIFAYQVREPQHYAVVDVSISEEGEYIPHALTEKPENPIGNLAVPGLYYYDNQVVAIAKSIKPSARGELEITDVNKTYLKNGQLKTLLFGRGIAWLDAGTHNSLLQAANFVQAIEERQGMMISCPEEIALHQGYIDKNKLKNIIQKMGKNEYRSYLEALL